MELIELRRTSATIQCSSCLKHVPEGLNMSLRRLASIQSKYDGPNQKSFCSVENSLSLFDTEHQCLCLQAPENQ